jgi:hypothetical protein
MWEVRVLRLSLALLLGVALLWPRALSAQSPDESEGSIRAGERFTYDTKDEITGECRTKRSPQW